MNRVIYNLTLDLKMSMASKVVVLKQGDVLTRELVVRLKVGVQPYDISDDTSAYLYVNGKAKYLAVCSVEGDTVRCVLPSDIVNEPCSDAEIRLTDETGAILTTPTFKIISEEAVYSDEAVEATNDFSALLYAIARAEGSRIATTEVVGDDLIVTYNDGTSVNTGRVVGDPFEYEDFTEEQLESLRGRPGDQGQRGSRWYSGIAMDGESESAVFPLSGIASAIEGDMYLNKESGGVYRCIKGGSPDVAEWAFVMFIGTATGGGVVVTSVLKLINLNGSAVLAAAMGSSVELKYNFTSTEDDIPTGDGTCKITVGGVVRTTFSIKQGENTCDVSEWLSPGENTVVVTCTDIYGNYRTLTYTVTVIELRIESTFDDTVTYSGSVLFKYTPYGLVDKKIHFILDGEEDRTVDVTTSGKQLSEVFPEMSHGVHTLEVYATAQMSGVDLESESILYDIMCVTEGETDVLIASPFVPVSVSQGEIISIPYSVYNPSSLEASIKLVISVGDEVYSETPLTVDRTRHTWNTRRYPIGEVTFSIVCGEVSKSHKITVTESDIKVEASTSDLELHLSAEGRNNNEDNPAVWVYGTIGTEFSGFNWKGTGWVDDENGDTCLRLSGDARATINFAPFADDLRVYGKTIEIDFAIRDVNTRGAVVLSCMSGGIGIELTADRAMLKSEQSVIDCRYTDGERIRLAFTVESRSEYRLLSVYLNGILSATKQYLSSDNFQQSTPAYINIGSDYCGIDIYNIRSYSTALTSIEEVNNMIADTSDVVRKRELYEANKVYDAYGNISYGLIRSKIPVMTIIGDLPTSKGDKKNVTVKFEHNVLPSLGFEDTAVIDVQGTSSQFYVVKNYKNKFSAEHQHAEGQMPTRIFCMKADYAEGTGTHNTQNANFVETLYEEKTPAQLVDARCRTTIFGYPCVIFHRTTDTSEPRFVGKYNFNFDKGSEEAFGFTSDFDVECWEFCNNTSDACLFKGEIPDSWGDDFEARYPDGYKDISRFKVMHDWVVSTAENVDKFKAEFEDHFDLHYCLIYYVYTFFALMVDQRAKNMFMTYWADTGKWQPWFYDNDTSFGINNQGELVYDYYHEDTDTIGGGANVFNGRESVLWVNFREAFADEIQEMYQSLRSSKKLTAEKIRYQFIEEGASKWSASVYNEDSEYKYISMLKSDNDASNLYQVRGTGETHLEHFLPAREFYCDSKWFTANFKDDVASFRIYTPPSWAGVEPNADITVTPYSNMYASVIYKANGTLQQERATAGVPVTFTAPDETFDNTETGVYGASGLSSIGDLAPLYCGSVNLSKATKLVEIKVGDAAEGYSNTYMNSLSVGTNRLLKRIDVRNCPNLTNPLDLSGCPHIEEIYATGSGITGVGLPDSGYLKIIHLPNTVTNLTIRNQPAITEFVMPDYSRLTTLRIENSPAIPTLDILAGMPEGSRVRILGFVIPSTTVAEMKAFCDRLDKMRGLDENGNNVDRAQVSGTVYIPSLASKELYEIQSRYPDISVAYSELITYTVRFWNGNTLLQTVSGVMYNGSAEYTGETPINTSATNPSDWAHNGWSPDPSVVQGDMDCYAKFKYAGSFARELVQRTIEGAYENDRVETIGNYAFYVASYITSVVFPAATTVGEYAFTNCVRLAAADFPVATNFGRSAFQNCSSLTALIIRSDVVATLSDANVLGGCSHILGQRNNVYNPNGAKDGYIYVPSALVDSYKAATNWSTYASQIRAIEDYPEICGGEA